MTCEEAWLLINGHLDGENTQAEEAQLREHLETCASCRELLQQLEQQDEALQTLQEEAPADLRENVMKAIRREASPRRRGWKRRTGLAVAAALVLAIGLTAIPPEADRETEPALMTARQMEEPAMQRAATYAAAYAEAPEENPAQELAEARSAAIVVLDHLPEELAMQPGEELEEGGRLYVLEHVEDARELSDRYALPLYLPTDGREPAAAYAYLLP